MQNHTRAGAPPRRTWTGARVDRFTAPRAWSRSVQIGVQVVAMTLATAGAGVASAVVAMKSTSFLALALAVSACVALPPPESAPESESEAPLTGPCLVHPHCSFEAPTAPPATLLEAQLGCTGRARYSEETNDDGAGPFCPDTPQTRQLGTGMFLESGYCDECITVPAGQIFVYFRRVEQPPLCPSTCRDVQ